MLKMILIVHVLGGAVALSSMGVPLVSRKGGTAHRKAGKVFVAGMTTVSITALFLSGWRLLFDGTADGRRMGVFLLFVAVLTGASVSAGVRVLRYKKRTRPHLHWWDVGLAAALTLGSAAAGVYGLAQNATLFSAFAVIGALTGAGQLQYWLRTPSGAMHWWFEHMTSMLGASIAAVTAFLVINAGLFGATPRSLAVWLAPSAIGTPITIAWVMYYRRKFGRVRDVRQADSYGMREPAGI